MTKDSVRFYDMSTKKSVVLPLSDEFKKDFLEKATFFPYPIVIKNEDHYVILHLDAEWNDRGTVITKVFVDLNELTKK